MRNVSITTGNFLLVIAGLMMLISGFYDSITVTNGDYRGVLIAALAAMAIGDVLCLHQMIIRRGLARWIAVIITIPSWFVMSDVVRRAPYVWQVSK